MLGAAASGPGMAGAECHRGRPLGVGLALPSWRPAWSWAWVWLRVAVAARRRVLGGCLAAVLGFGRAAGAGLGGAWALAAVGLLTVGTGLGARSGGFPRGLWGGVLDEDVVVVVNEVVVVVQVVESEAEERAVGDGGGSWAAGAGVGCWVLRVVKTRARVWAPSVCARCPW